MSKGFGRTYREQKDKSGKSVRISRPGPIHRFLLDNFQNEELLKSLYAMVAEERHLLKRDAEDLLKTVGILDESGLVTDEAKEIIIESIIVQDDGTLTLEI